VGLRRADELVKAAKTGEPQPARCHQRRWGRRLWPAIERRRPNRKLNQHFISGRTTRSRLDAANVPRRRQDREEDTDLAFGTRSARSRRSDSWLESNQARTAAVLGAAAGLVASAVVLTVHATERGAA